MANQVQYIDDATLDLANRIAKYEYGAYAFVMAASTAASIASSLPGASPNLSGASWRWDS